MIKWLVTSARAAAVSLIAALTSFFSLPIPSNDLGNYEENNNHNHNVKGRDGSLWEGESGCDN